MRDRAKRKLQQNRPKLSVAEDRCLLDVRDLAKILRVTPYWVRRQVNAGRFIPSFLLAPKTRRFRASDVENYIVKQLAKANPEDVPAVEAATTEQKA